MVTPSSNTIRQDLEAAYEQLRAVRNTQAYSSGYSGGGGGNFTSGLSAAPFGAVVPDNAKAATVYSNVRVVYRDRDRDSLGMIVEGTNLALSARYANCMKETGFLLLTVQNETHLIPAGDILHIEILQLTSKE